MATDYTVKQGDHLAKIAKRFGFLSVRLIWNHPKNAKLRKLRQNPNVLLPGDVVHVPDRTAKIVSRSVGQQHTFQLRGEALLVRVVLLDLRRELIPGEKVTLVLGNEMELSTDGEGKLEHQIDPSTELGAIRLKHGDADLRVGHLDPIEEESGVRARLSNLGYLIGEVEDAEDVEELKLALQEFQADFALPFTGELDDATRSKLLEVHGC